MYPLLLGAVGVWADVAAEGHACSGMDAAGVGDAGTGDAGMTGAGQVPQSPRSAVRCDPCCPITQVGRNGLSAARQPGPAKPCRCQRQSLGICTGAAFVAVKWPFSNMPLFPFYNVAQQPKNGSVESLWHQGG